MTKPANDTIITIWLTNLGAYAGGQLIDCELNLPCDPEEIDEALKKIGVQPGINEAFIPCWESEYNMNCGEYDNPYRINEEAEALAGLDIDPEILKALLNEGYTAEQIESLDYYYYDDCNSMTDVAYRVIEEGGYFDKNTPEFLTRYFDYEAFGRDLGFEGHWIATDTGYIEVIE